MLYLCSSLNCKERDMSSLHLHRLSDGACLINTVSLQRMPNSALKCDMQKKKATSC